MSSSHTNHSSGSNIVGVHYRVGKKIVSTLGAEMAPH